MAPSHRVFGTADDLESIPRELERRLPQPQRATCISHRFLGALPWVSLVLLVASLLLDRRVGPAISSGLRNFGTGTLYRLHKRRNTKSPVELFLNLNPIFTRTVNERSLRKVLAGRRKLRGGFFENSIVSACSDNSAVLRTTLASWSLVRGVREIVMVDHDSRQEDQRKSLEIMDSIDRLGRMVYVTLVHQDLSRNMSGIRSISRALNLGVTLASGKTVLLVSCDAKLSQHILLKHQLANKTFYAGSASKGWDVAPSNYEVLVVSKHDFEAVSGFDERIDVAGSQYSDLATRLRRQLRLRRLSMDSRMIEKVIVNSEVPSAAIRDVSFHETDDVIQRSRAIPELGRHFAHFAKKELPVWDGVSPDPNHRPMPLSAVRFSVPREQFESLRHSKPKLSFGTERESDYRLWIHALSRTKPRSLSTLLPKATLDEATLRAHRKFLHDNCDVPYSLLTLIESLPARCTCSSQKYGEDANTTLTARRRDISNYFPVLLDIVWHKKKFLVVNLEVDQAMEMFIGLSWAIAKSLLSNRALLISGRLAGSPLCHVVDLETTVDVLHREYNVKASIMGGPERNDCDVKHGEQCWADDEAVANWYELKVVGKRSPTQLNASQHVWLNIDTTCIQNWKASSEATLSSKRLFRQAFASISLSRAVGEHVADVNETLTENVRDATAVLTSGHVQRAKQFGAEFLKYQASPEGPRQSIFVSGSSAVSIDRLTSYLPMSTRTEGPFNAVRRTTDLWIALQSKNIVFDSTAIPRIWAGTESAILEWRRIHAPEVPSGGVSHVLPSNNTSSLGFHILVFDDALAPEE